MCEEVDFLHGQMLQTPLASTGYRPHFYLSFDKSTFSRTSNQLVVICPVLNGARRSIIVNASSVYSLHEADDDVLIAGGSDISLANDIKGQIQRHFPSLSFEYAMGACADGQYRSNVFNTELFGDSFRTVMWDQAHLLELVFKDGCKGASESFMSLIQKRLSLFHRKLKHGLGNVSIEAAAAELKVKGLKSKSYNMIRFFPSLLAALKNLVDNFPTYQKALHEYGGVIKEGPNSFNEEIYLLFGNDFIYDAFLIIDILEVMKTVSVHCQKLGATFWSTIPLLNECEAKLQKMQEALAKSDVTSATFPKLSQFEESIRTKRFQEDGTMTAARQQSGVCESWNAVGRTAYNF